MTRQYPSGPATCRPSRRRPSSCSGQHDRRERGRDPFILAGIGLEIADAAVAVGGRRDAVPSAADAVPIPGQPLFPPRPSHRPPDCPGAGPASARLAVVLSLPAHPVRRAGHRYSRRRTTAVGSGPPVRPSPRSPSTRCRPGADAGPATAPVGWCGRSSSGGPSRRRRSGPRQPAGGPGDVGAVAAAAADARMWPVGQDRGGAGRRLTAPRGSARGAR